MLTDLNRVSLSFIFRTSSKVSGRGKPRLSVRKRAANAASREKEPKTNRGEKEPWGREG